MYIEEKIKDILIELSGVGDISTVTKLQDDLALDSLAMVTLLVEIEDFYKIQLDESDMNPFDLETVYDVITLVSKYVGERNG